MKVVRVTRSRTSNLIYGNTLILAGEDPRLNGKIKFIHFRPTAVGIMREGSFYEVSGPGRYRIMRSTSVGYNGKYGYFPQRIGDDTPFHSDEVGRIYIGRGNFPSDHSPNYPTCYAMGGESLGGLLSLATRELW